MGLQPTVAEGSGCSSSSNSAPQPPVDYSESNDIGRIKPLLGLIGLLALAINFLYFSYFRNHYAPDTLTYRTPAANLIQGKGFTDSHGHPETLIPPGYSLIIALFLRVGLDLKYLVILQHLAQVFLAAATAAAAFKLTSSRRQALIAGILVSIDFAMLEAANYILTDTIFATMLALILWLLWTASNQPEDRWPTRLVFSGLLAGASALIRPIAGFFFLPVIIYLLLSRRRFRLRAILAFLLPFISLQLLWALRNYHEAGYFGVSSLSGVEVLCCRAPGILALDDPGDFNTNISRRRAQLESAACAELQAIKGKDCSELSFAEKSKYFMRAGSKIVLQHPWGYVRLTVRGAALVLLDGGPTTLAGITGIDQHLGIKLLLIYTVPALLFAILGLWEFWKQNRRLCLLAFLTIGYFVLLASGGESYSRYRVPIVPAYAILIAAGIDWSLRHFHRQIPA